MKTIPDKEKNKKVLFLVLIIPVFCLYLFSLSYLNSLNRQIGLNMFEKDSDIVLTRLKNSADTEKFVCQSLQSISLHANSPEELKEKILGFGSGLQLKFELCVWDENGEVLFNDFDRITQQNLKQIFESLGLLKKTRAGFANDFEALEFPKSPSSVDESADSETMPVDVEAKIRATEQERLKELLGPEFHAIFYTKCYEGKNLRLIRTDVGHQSPLLWLKVSQKFGAMLSFAPGDLKKNIGLHQLLGQEKANDRMIIGFTDGTDKFSNRDFSLPDGFEIFTSRFSPEKAGKYLIKSNFIANNLVGFCLTDEKAIKGDFFARNSGGENFIILFFPFFVAFLSYMFLFRHKNLGFSIRLQFLLVFLFANLTSGLVISIIFKDFLLSFHANLEQKALNDSIEILKTCDDLYLNELTFQKIQLEKKLKQLRQRLSLTGIKADLISDLLQDMEPPPSRMYLVGSKSAELASEDGIVTKRDVLVDFSGKLKSLSIVLKFIRLMKEVGQFYLNKINNEEISFKEAYKAEAIIESLSKQKPTEQMLQFFEHDSNFWEWGFWSSIFPSYIKTFRIGENSKFDYTFLYMWLSIDLQRHYLESSLIKLSKNDLGLKLFAIDNNLSVCLPHMGLKKGELKIFAEKIQAKESNRFSKINFENQDCFFLSIPGNRLVNFYLIGILPTDKISKEIKDTETFLIKLFLFCILISAVLGIVVSSTILNPLAELELGAKAIQKRDFSFRLPNLGENEFGNLGQVLNDLFVDYEEVSSASVIREKLIDSCKDPVKAGNLVIFSLTFPVADSCHDFLYFRRPGEEKFDFLLGAPEQKGVSANLILAFTKGALIQFENENRPFSDNLPMLHGLFRKCNQNSFQHKTIALLQGIVDGDKSEISLRNAGLKYSLVYRGGDLSVLDLPESLPVGDNEYFACNLIKTSLAKDEILFLFSHDFASKQDFARIRKDLEAIIRQKSAEDEIERLVDSYFLSQFAKKEIRNGFSLVVIYGLHDRVSS